MTETWRLLPYSVGATARNFAHSDALARLATGPTVWWHSTDRPTVILGAGQREDQVNRAACDAAGVLVVKRQAGGTAVYAGPGVLGLDVALPPGHLLVLADIVETYRWLGETWLRALRSLGVEGHLVTIQEARSQPAGPYADIVRLACFGRLSPYEVTVDGRKLVGLAQVRRRGRTLLQAGIHLRFDAEGLAGLLPAAETAVVAPVLAQAAVGLNDIVSTPLNEFIVMDAFSQALSEEIGVGLEAGEWSAEERQLAEGTQTFDTGVGSTA